MNGIQKFVQYSDNLIGPDEASYFQELFDSFDVHDRIQIDSDLERCTEDEYDLMFCIEEEPVLPSWASDALRAFHGRWMSDSKDC